MSRDILTVDLTKDEALGLLGDGHIPTVSRALRVSRHAIYQWPAVLSPHLSDRVRGAALRTGRIKVRVGR